MRVQPPPCLLLELTRRYCEPHRHYHAIGHVAAMLQRGSQLGIDDAQVLAIWFHDAIYDVHRADNEERSAELAETLLRGAGYPVETVATVAQIVRDTKTHRPTIESSKLVLDLDLMSLALPWPEFAANTEAIRREYAHVDEAAFREGRRRFFTAMLERPKLFWTPFGEGLEARARANLAKASQ